MSWWPTRQIKAIQWNWKWYRSLRKACSFEWIYKNIHCTIILKKRRCSKVIHDITGIANVSPKTAKLSHSLHSTTTNLKERKKHRFSYDIIRPVYADKKKFTETRCSFLFPCIFMNRVASVFVRSVTLWICGVKIAIRIKLAAVNHSLNIRFFSLHKIRLSTQTFTKMSTKTCLLFAFCSNSTCNINDIWHNTQFT